MVRILKYACVTAAVLALGAPGMAGSAEAPVTRDLGWKGGDSFGVGMSADVTFTQGPVAKIVVTGPKEVLDHVVLEGDTVRIRDFTWWGWNAARYGRVTIVASAPHVRQVNASASARIDVGAMQEPTLDMNASSSASIRGTLQATTVNLKASSSGSIRGTVKAQALRASAHSSARVNVGGSADRVDADASSSGDVDLRELTVRDATIRASSSGDVVASPSRSADAKASSSGSVRLLQRPPQLNSETSSSGSIRVG